MTPLGMARRRPSALLLTALLVLAGAPAQARPPVNAEPVASFPELFRVLTACWMPPPGTEGFEITFRFGLTAAGELRGRPLATYSLLPGPQELKRAFVAAAIQALSDCTPVRMTPDFARVAAARVLNVRLASKRGRGRPA